MPTETDDILVLATRDAIRGDKDAVQGWILAITNRNSVHDRRARALDVKILEGWVAAADRDWQEVIRIAKPIAIGGPEPLLAGRLPARWLLAQACEGSGDLVDAAVEYESIISPTRTANTQMAFHTFQRAVYETFAHHRLVLLYSKMGRVEDARRHWEIFEKTFTNPDPELVPMIEEAREALAQAEAEI